MQGNYKIEKMISVSGIQKKIRQTVKICNFRSLGKYGHNLWNLNRRLEICPVLKKLKRECLPP